MRLTLLLLPILFLAGCSHRPAVPTNSNSPAPMTIDTRAQVESEIDRRVGMDNSKPHFNRDTIAAALDILDNTQNERTALAVKDWASDIAHISKSIADSGIGAPSAQPGADAALWTEAAADAKAALIRGETPANDYDSSKAKALAAADQADLLAPTPMPTLGPAPTMAP